MKLTDVALVVIGAAVGYLLYKDLKKKKCNCASSTAAVAATNPPATSQQTPASAMNASGAGKR